MFIIFVICSWAECCILHSQHNSGMSDALSKLTFQTAWKADNEGMICPTQIAFATIFAMLQCSAKLRIVSPEFCWHHVAFQPVSAPCKPWLQMAPWATSRAPSFAPRTSSSARAT